MIAEPNRWLPLFLRICQGPKPPTRHAPDRLATKRRSKRERFASSTSYHRSQAGGGSAAFWRAMPQRSWHRLDWRCDTH